MTETTSLRTLLLPELEHEFAKTRKMLTVVPDGHNDFKPHEKSMSLSHLAGHVAEMPEFIVTMLTSPDLDMGKTPFVPYRMETKQQAIAHFDQAADAAITAVKQTSDETFHQFWKLTYHGHPIFTGDRYTAYREMGVNHIVHHRAQLGVYLRLLNVAIPGTYGPSADEM
jgi:uncharacterized damage-inducible protein DinB